MALLLDRQIELILLGPQSGQTFGAPTLTRVWGRLLSFNVDTDPTTAGVIPEGAAKVAIRYREDLATRTAFPGTWTPSTPDETAMWDKYSGPTGSDIQDSFTVDGIIFVLTETAQLLEQDRRRYITLYGTAIGKVE